MNHDYHFRYRQFKLELKGYATIDLHKVTAVVHTTVIMDNGVRLGLTSEDASELESILLNMDKDFREAS